MSGGRTIITPISIHAPRAGCDSTAQAGFVGWINFNPRTPCGVRREGIRYEKADGEISIHAPRAGCDRVCAGGVSERFDFNPRTPCGVRPLRSSYGSRSAGFQSTHPVRGATPLVVCPLPYDTISIHAPRAGCDVITSRACNKKKNFNPRTPCGVRPAGLFLSNHIVRISIHAPRAGCDHRQGSQGNSRRHFNPRTPCGVRLIPDF